ncbi:hypothetical protein, partial [Enterococcus faecium]
GSGSGPELRHRKSDGGRGWRQQRQVHDTTACGASHPTVGGTALGRAYRRHQQPAPGHKVPGQFG